MYAHEIGRIAEEPHGAALTTPNDFALDPRACNGFIIGWLGKKGDKWDFLEIFKYIAM